MKIKIDKRLLDNTNFMIIAAVIAACTNAYVSLPTSGIISTFPLAFLISAGMTYVVKKFYLLPTVTFVVTYLFAMFFNTPRVCEDLFGGYALRVSLKVAVISLFGCFFVVLIKNKDMIIKKSWLTVSLSVVIITVAILLNCFESGTPWSYISAKNDITDILEQRFDTEGVKISKVYAVPGTKTYACDVSTPISNKVAFVKSDNGKMYETVTELFTEVLTSDSTVEFTAILRKEFPNDSFEVKCSYTGLYKKRLSLKETDSVQNHLTYTVSIHSEETAKSFLIKAKEYFKAISDAGIPCNNLIINGGVRRKMFYTLQGNPYIPESFNYTSYENALMPYSN